MDLPPQSILATANVGVSLSTKLYTFATATASTDKDITDIAGDVALTSNVLTNVGLFLADGRRRFASKSAIQDANSILKRCEDAFKEIQNLTDRNLKNQRLPKIAWQLSRGPRFELLKKRLESLKSSLMLLLSVLNFKKDQATLDHQGKQQQCQSIQHLYHRHQEALVNVSQLEKRLEATTLNDKACTPPPPPPSRDKPSPSKKRRITDSFFSTQRSLVVFPTPEMTFPTMEKGSSTRAVAPAASMSPVQDSGQSDLISKMDTAEIESLIRRAQQYLNQIESMAASLSSHSTELDSVEKIVRNESHQLFNFLGQYLKIDISQIPAAVPKDIAFERPGRIRETLLGVYQDAYTTMDETNKHSPSDDDRGRRKPAKAGLAVAQLLNPQSRSHSRGKSRSQSPIHDEVTFHPRLGPSLGEGQLVGSPDTSVNSFHSTPDIAPQDTQFHVPDSTVSEAYFSPLTSPALQGQNHESWLASSPDTLIDLDADLRDVDLNLVRLHEKHIKHDTNLWTRSRKRTRSLSPTRSPAPNDSSSRGRRMGPIRAEPQQSHGRALQARTIDLQGSDTEENDAIDDIIGRYSGNDHTNTMSENDQLLMADPGLSDYDDDVYKERTAAQSPHKLTLQDLDCEPFDLGQKPDPAAAAAQATEEDYVFSKQRDGVPISGKGMSGKDAALGDDAPNLRKAGRISKAKKGVRGSHRCECGKRYSRAEHLRRHRQNHQNHQPTLFCSVPSCGKSFNRQDVLNRHITSIHDRLIQGPRTQQEAHSPILIDLEADIEHTITQTTYWAFNSPEQGIVQVSEGETRNARPFTEAGQSLSDSKLSTFYLVTGSSTDSAEDFKKLQLQQDGGLQAEEMSLENEAKKAAAQALTQIATEAGFSPLLQDSPINLMLNNSQEPPSPMDVENKSESSVRGTKLDFSRVPKRTALEEVEDDAVLRNDSVKKLSRTPPQTHEGVAPLKHPNVSSLPADTFNLEFVADGPDMLENFDFDSFLIKCFCGFRDDDGHIVFCGQCETWQHIACYYPGQIIPEDHFCVLCKPRPFDKVQAVRRQETARELSKSTHEKKDVTKNHKQNATSFRHRVFSGPHETLRKRQTSVNCAGAYDMDAEATAEFGAMREVERQNLVNEVRDHKGQQSEGAPNLDGTATAVVLSPPSKRKAYFSEIPPRTPSIGSKTAECGVRKKRNTGSSMAVPIENPKLPLPPHPTPSQRLAQDRMLFSPTSESKPKNHALQDYSMQLMLLEQQNKKRLLMARQEIDNIFNPPAVEFADPQRHKRQRSSSLPAAMDFSMACAPISISQIPESPLQDNPFTRPIDPEYHDSRQLAHFGTEALIPSPSGFEAKFAFDSARAAIQTVEPLEFTPDLSSDTTELQSGQKHRESSMLVNNDGNSIGSGGLFPLTPEAILHYQNMGTGMALSAQSTSGLPNSRPAPIISDHIQPIIDGDLDELHTLLKSRSNYQNTDLLLSPQQLPATIISKKAAILSAGAAPSSTPLTPFTPMPPRTIRIRTVSSSCHGSQIPTFPSMHTATFAQPIPQKQPSTSLGGPNHPSESTVVKLLPTLEEPTIRGEGPSREETLGQSIFPLAPTTSTQGQQIAEQPSSWVSLCTYPCGQNFAESNSPIAVSSDQEIENERSRTLARTIKQQADCGERRRIGEHEEQNAKSQPKRQSFRDDEDWLFAGITDEQDDMGDGDVVENLLARWTVDAVA